MQFRHPWRPGNRYDLLVDGPEFFPEMLDAIRRARRSVLFENYIVDSGAVMKKFIREMVAACERGVFVSLMLDGYGSSSLGKRDRRALAEAGCELNFFNPFFLGKLQRNMFRDHRKLVLVDGEVAFVGWFIVVDGYDPPDGGEPVWHDAAVRIEGPCVHDWFDLFRRNREDLRAELKVEAAEIPPSGDGAWGRLTASEPTHNEIKPALIEHIDRAKERVWVMTPYFLPPASLRRALRRAADRDVDVRLLLAGKKSDLPLVHHINRRFYHRLIRHGVRIFEYQPRYLHAKIALCDQWVSIGSSNFDRWNFHWNLEANQEIVDQRFRGKVEKLFRDDLGASREIRSTGFWIPFRPTR